MYAAHHPLDEPHVRIEPGCLREERLEVDPGFDDLLELLTGVAREPGDDLVDLCLRPPLLRGLLYIERIQAPERDPEDSGVLVHARRYE